MPPPVKMEIYPWQGKPLSSTFSAVLRRRYYKFRDNNTRGTRGIRCLPCRGAAEIVLYVCPLPPLFLPSPPCNASPLSQVAVISNRGKYEDEFRCRKVKPRTEWIQGLSIEPDPNTLVLSTRMLRLPPILLIEDKQIARQFVASGTVARGTIRMIRQMIWQFDFFNRSSTSHRFPSFNVCESALYCKFECLEYERYTIFFVEEN